MTASYDSAPDDVEPTHNHAARLADDLHDRSSALQGQVEAGGAARRYGLRLKTYQSLLLRPARARLGAAAHSAAALSTPGMGDRLGVKVPWRKRWC